MFRRIKINIVINSLNLCITQVSLTVSLLDKWIQLIKIQPIEYYTKKFHSYKMKFNGNIKRYKI